MALVKLLGGMRGAAMKVGQLFSTLDLGLVPVEIRDEVLEILGSLQHSAEPVPFADVRRVVEADLGRRLTTVFAHVDPEPLAAASIGQVHRATTLDGDQVVVKVQYPGVAEAVETDLRNAMLLVPLVKRLAPGLDAKALATEMRERIAEELDYELEAQNQRRVERLMRGHPFMCVPRVYTDLSTRRVLVSEYIDGARFEEVRGAGEAERDRYGEIVFRFFFGLLYRDRIALGDPHPGNYLLRPSGQVCFLDFGLLRDIGAPRVTAEAAIALAVRDEDAANLKASLVTGGYLPGDRADAVDADFALRMMQHAVSWYAVPGEHRFSTGDDRRGRDRERERPDGDERAEMKTQFNQFTLPPEAILIRRMHGVVAIVLRALRAGANWGAIAAEYLHGEPPATPLGEAEAAFLASRGR